MKSYLLPLLQDTLRMLGAPEGTEIVLDLPRSSGRGDITTGIAFALAGHFGRTPHDIAQDILARLALDKELVTAKIARGGFINFNFTPKFLQSRVQEALHLGNEYGFSTGENGQSTSIPHPEFPEESAEGEDAEKHPLRRAIYAHAQAAGLLRHAEMEGIDTASDADLSVLKLPLELTVMRQILLLPAMVARSSRDHDSKFLADYLGDLANAFNTFHQECRIIPEPEPIRDARLRLVVATELALGNGLRALGIGDEEREQQKSEDKSQG